MSTNLTLRVLSPSADLFSGEVRSVSSVNSAGRFDVLPLHANFITIIENQPIIVRTADGGERKFQFPQAILHCRQNQVAIYTNLLESEQLLPSAPLN